MAGQPVCYESSEPWTGSEIALNRFGSLSSLHEESPARRCNSTRVGLQSYERGSQVS